MSPALRGQTSRQLIDRADNACREAKRKGRNQVVIFQDGEQEGERQRHQVEMDVLDRLRRTKEFRDFELAIQPVVGLGESNRLGGEILLRHRTPDGTLRSPAGLIEAAITELAVAPLPLPTIRGRGTEVDASGLERYAKGVLDSLAVMGINRRLVEMRSRHRRMSPQEEGYRELFSQIAALEQRRMQIRQGT